MSLNGEELGLGITGLERGRDLGVPCRGEVMISGRLRQDNVSTAVRKL